MELLSNRRRVSTKLPYDSKIEYIEGNGNLYINTGLSNIEGFYTKVTFSRTNIGNYQCLIGSNSYDGTMRNFIMFREAAYHAATYNIFLERSYLFTAYKKYTVEFNTIKPTMWIKTNTDRWSVNNNAGLMENKPIWILRFLYRLPYPCPARLYYVYIKTPTDEMELIPVRKDGKGYLYDKISGKLLGNAGTGNFILGPDIKVGGGNSIIVNNLCGYSIERRAA